MISGACRDHASYRSLAIPGSALDILHQGVNRPARLERASRQIDLEFQIDPRIRIPP
jgi:hypothetical protein